MPDVVAILLAAGESRRMGQLKALLPWQGTSLLEHQVAALMAGGASRVIVVVGHQSERLTPLLEGKPGVVGVLNPDYLQGKTSSIKAGLNALAQDPPRTLLILNVDQPRSAGTIRSLIDAHCSKTAVITIPTYQKKGGHPILVDGSLLQEMLSIEEESQGMKEVVQRHAERTQRVEMDTPEVLWDLNTPEQYQAVLDG